MGKPYTKVGRDRLVEAFEDEQREAAEVRAYDQATALFEPGDRVGWTSDKENPGRWLSATVLEVQRNGEVAIQTHGDQRTSRVQLAVPAADLFPIAPQRGRPAKPAGEQRRLRSLYLTDAEYAAVQARIPPGEEFSDWVRRQLLSE